MRGRCRADTNFEFLGRLGSARVCLGRPCSLIVEGPPIMFRLVQGGKARQFLRRVGA
jgi:hypothetical protein